MNDYVVIDGTKYSYNEIADETKKADFSVTYNAKVVLDEYGYILHVDTAVSNSNYLYVRVAKDLSGLGKTKLCSIISISLTAARIPLALILRSTALGLCGVWWALTLTSILKGITFFLAFRRTARRL